MLCILLTTRYMPHGSWDSSGQGHASTSTLSAKTMLVICLISGSTRRLSSPLKEKANQWLKKAAGPLMATSESQKLILHGMILRLVRQAPFLRVWWIHESSSSVFTKRWIAITSGSNASLAPLWKPSLKHRTLWSSTIIICMRFLIAPGLHLHIWRLRLSLKKWTLSETLNGRGLPRRSSGLFQF